MKNLIKSLAEIIVTVAAVIIAYAYIAFVDIRSFVVKKLNLKRDR